MLKPFPSASVISRRLSQANFPRAVISKNKTQVPGFVVKSVCRHRYYTPDYIVIYWDSIDNRNPTEGIEKSYELYLFIKANIDERAQLSGDTIRIYNDISIYT